MIETKISSMPTEAIGKIPNWEEIRSVIKDTFTFAAQDRTDNIFTYYHRTKTHIWGKNEYGVRMSVPFVGNESWIYEICKRKFGTLIKLDRK